MKLPDFKYEKEQWKRGAKLVAGADEVGRGAFAGPLVAAAVIFPSSLARTILANLMGIKINDSKKLNTEQREKADMWIRENCLAWGIGEVSVALINRIGVAKASKMVFRRAVKNMNIDFLLVDAFYVPYTRGIKRKNQLAIIKGDTKSFSIASASIVAKVYRDKLMKDLSKKHTKYMWDKNAGYGTKEHIMAIKKYGPTRLHRKQFIKKLLSS